VTERWSDRLAWWVAFTLLPRRIAYLACIRVWANASTGKYGHRVAPSVTITEMLDAWEATA